MCDNPMVRLITVVFLLSMLLGCAHGRPDPKSAMLANLNSLELPDRPLLSLDSDEDTRVFMVLEDMSAQTGIMITAEDRWWRYFPASVSYDSVPPEEALRTLLGNLDYELEVECRDEKVTRIKIHTELERR